MHLKETQKSLLEYYFLTNALIKHNIAMLSSMKETHYLRMKKHGRPYDQYQELPAILSRFQ